MQGGGMFLVTAVGFELQLHPTPPEGVLTSLTAVFPVPETVSALAWFSDWKDTAPFELQSSLAMLTLPTLGPATVIETTSWDPENSTRVNEAMQVTCLCSHLLACSRATIIQVCVAPTPATPQPARDPLTPMPSFFSTARRAVC